MCICCEFGVSRHLIRCVRQKQAKRYKSIMKLASGMEPALAKQMGMDNASEADRPVCLFVCARPTHDPRPCPSPPPYFASTHAHYFPLLSIR